MSPKEIEMTARTRTARPAKANLEAIADGTVARQNDGIDTPAPAPTSVRPARRAKSTPAPAKSEAPARRRRPAPVAVQADALTPEAAATLIGADGSLIRHTHEYTVDLLDEGIEPERDFAKVLAKSPSETHHDYVAWVQEHVGVEIDVRTVQILISTYHEFQRTPAQKAKTIAKRVAAAQKRGEAEARKAEKAKAGKAPVAK